MQTFQYSPLGFQVGTSTTSGGTTSQTNYLVDPAGLMNVVASYDGNGSLLAHYNYGIGLVSQTGPSGTGYYDFDGSGNTVGITGSTGTYINQYSYLPFGETTTVSAALPNPFTFSGQLGVMQIAPNLFDMRARNYLPDIGQFLSNDPAGIASGSANIRTYVGNNPLSYVDPTGLCKTQAQKLAKIQQDLSNWWNGLSPIEQGAFAVTAAAGVAAGALGLPGLIGGISALAAGEMSALATGTTVTGLLSLGLLGKALGDAGRNPTSWLSSLNFTHFPFQQLQNDIQDLFNSKTTCPPPKKPNHPKKPMGHGSSSNKNKPDPNALLGPAGFGPQGFIQATGNLSYTVDFASESTGSAAAAQDVTITEQLDPNLDWSTFQLGSFGFGTVNVAVPAGLTQYQTTIPYHNQDGSALNVQVKLDFNVQTGLLTATFTSIDPLTGQAPTGVFDGFLPPDNSSGIGEGFVQYTVQAKSGLASGATISGQASSVFDINPPLNTNIVTNSIDAAPPTSSVNPLPATVNSPNFNVSWSGSDAKGPGIASYNVYVSDNGGAFTPWLTNTAQTSATYNGQVGHHYSFYSVATDALGITQPTPSGAQATTYVFVPTPPPPPPPPHHPPAPPTLQVPPLLAFFDSLLGGVETINANGTEMITDSIFGIPLIVANFDGAGKLSEVTLFGINVTLLFELL